MKYLKYILLVSYLFVATTTFAAVTFPVNGGTGTNVIPTLGEVLVGQSNGLYLPVATSTLGFSDYWTLSGSNLFNNVGSLIGIGTTSPWAQLSVDTTNLLNGAAAFAVGSSTKTALAVQANGDVTINTNTPNAAGTELTITGSATNQVGVFVNGLTSGIGFQTSATTGNGFADTALSSGSGLDTTISTTGNGVLFNTTAAAMTTATGFAAIGTANMTADYTGELAADIEPVRNVAAAATRLTSGNIIKVMPIFSTTAALKSINTVTGTTTSLGQIEDNASTGAGSAVLVSAPQLSVSNSTLHSANVFNSAPVFSVYQNATSSATGTVMTLNNSGLGNLATFVGNGFFGIGTTTPGWLLSVAGNLGLTGTLTIPGTADGCATWAGGILGTTGIACGSGGGSGTVNSGTLGQNAYYAANGTAVTGTSTIFTDVTSNVGIGSTTPGYKLGVDGSASFGSSVTVTRRADFDNQGNLSIFDSNNATPSPITLNNYGITAINQGQTLTAVNASTTPFTGIGNYSSGRITFITEGDYTTLANSKTGIAFLTQNGNNAAAERVRITSAGNVGIGSSTPSATLALQGNSFFYDSSSQSSGAHFYFNAANSGTGSNADVVGITTGRASSSGFNLLDVYGVSGPTTAPAFLVRGDGNVGIGTTTPGANLAINGTTGQSFFQIASSTNQNILNVDVNGNVAMSGGLSTASVNVTGSSIPLNGMYLTGAGGNLNFTTAGVTRFIINSGGVITAQGTLKSTSSGGYILLTGSTSGANPVLVPNQVDQTTGIGADASGNISLITAATTKLEVLNNGNVGVGSTSPSQLLSVGGNAYVSGIATSSGYSLNIGNPVETGIYSSAGNNLQFAANNTLAFAIASNGTTAFSHSINSSGASSWFFNVQNTSATNPDLVPNRTDTTTGIGADASGDVSIINGALETARFTAATTTFFGTGGINLTNGCVTYNGGPCIGSGSSFAYPFPGDATSTLLTFNGGINVGAASTYQFNNTTVITGSTTLDDYYFGPAGSASYTGTDNTGFGAGALSSISTGSRDTAVGRQSLDGNTTGNDTTAVGFFAGNTGVGAYDDDTFIGAWTNENVGSVFASTTEVGYKAGYNNGGNGNTLLGYQNAFDLTSGANNISIGQDVDLPSATASGQLNIGNLIYGTGAYTGGTPSSAPTGGNLGIGTTTPGYPLSVAGTGYFTGGVRFGDGTVQTTAAVGTTYTAGTGLTLTGSAFNVNASQNITTLSNLTTAGFVQTTSGGVLSSAALTSGQVTTALGFTPASFSGTIGQVGYFNGTNTSIGTSTITIATNSNVGFGTSTPFANVGIQNNFGSNLITAFAVASSTAANGSTASTLFSIRNTGHIITGGPAPSVSWTGVGDSVSGNDSAGIVTEGTGTGNTITVTFANQYDKTPVCVGNLFGGVVQTVRISSQNSSSVTWTLGAAGSGDKFNYICQQ